jgi:hypothetical protein
MKTRAIRVDGNIAYIQLSNGYEALVDAADAQLVGGFNWQARVDKHTVYVRRTVYIQGVHRTAYLHRLLMDAKDGEEVDHISSNGLDNRRSNLRLATRAQNSRNTKPSSSNTSGFKGASFNKSKNKWVAHIQHLRKKFFLGYYESPADAHAAYCEASTHLHGEFGRTI